MLPYEPFPPLQPFELHVLSYGICRDLYHSKNVGKFCYDALKNVVISSNSLPLKPNDAYICRTAPLTSRRCILYIYSTHVSTAYFKHATNSPFFPLQNAVYFIILHCLVPVLFAFYIQGVRKFKCKIQAPKG